MKSISSLSVLLFTIILISSCGKQESGQLTGVQDRPKWGGFNPFGMVYVPSGTLTIGQSDQDVFYTYTQRQKSISISGFFLAFFYFKRSRFGSAPIFEKAGYRDS